VNKLLSSNNRLGCNYLPNRIVKDQTKPIGFSPIDSRDGSVPVFSPMSLRKLFEDFRLRYREKYLSGLDPQRQPARDVFFFTF
jgi:hypothetical protein